MNATTPLPANATPTMISTTTVVKTTAATTSRAVRPIRASNRPRTLCQASSMVMLEPKTARPTTTVNMPESRIAASTVASAPAAASSVEALAAIPVSDAEVAKVRRALLFHEAKVLADHEASFAAFRATGKAPTPTILRQAQERIAKDALKWVKEQAAAVAAPVPAAK